MPSKQNRIDRNGKQREAGFSLLEMVIATSLLSIGLLATASAIGYALMAGNNGRAITNTKLLVASMLEQMETLRNTGSLTFGQIANVGAVDSSGATRAFAGFQTGFRAVSTNPGPDGIFGTADDLNDAGNDGIYGTADDFVNNALALPGVTRQIQITSLSTTLKKITVTVNYSPSQGTARQLVGICYLNDNSQSNYVP